MHTVNKFTRNDNVRVEVFEEFLKLYTVCQMLLLKLKGMVNKEWLEKTMQI